MEEVCVGVWREDGDRCLSECCESGVVQWHRTLGLVADWKKNCTEQLQGEFVAQMHEETSGSVQRWRED